MKLGRDDPRVLREVDGQAQNDDKGLSPELSNSLARTKQPDAVVRSKQRLALAPDRVKRHKDSATRMAIWFWHASHRDTWPDSHLLPRPPRSVEHRKPPGAR
jgi:hypothetical protein